MSNRRCFQDELETRWAAVNRNQAVIQALEGIENGEVLYDLIFCSIS